MSRMECHERVRTNRVIPKTICILRGQEILGDDVREQKKMLSKGKENTQDRAEYQKLEQSDQYFSHTDRDYQFEYH